MVDAILVVGFVAAFLTTFSFLPQTIKTIKMKETKDLSLVMYAMLWFGMISWLIYGVLKNDPPIIIANIISISFASIVLFLKIKYG